MGRHVKIEIHGKDEFWGRAFHVEWEHQFPARKLVAGPSSHFLVDDEWYGDLERVAAQCYCRIVRAPDDPRRRRWIRSLIPPLGKN